MQRHSHDEAHFVLVLPGGYIVGNRRTASVEHPGVIYNPPGATHQDRFHAGRGRFVAISGGGEGGEAAALCIRDPYAFRLAQNIALDLDAAPALTLEARALQLHAAVLPPTSDEPRRASSPPVWLKRAVEMIFTSSDPELSVAGVAADAGVHPVHLARVFRRFLGCSAGDYLRGHRLERAAAMLGSGTASLADVAQSAGFVDEAHLTRTFRSSLDTTPVRWRRLRNVAQVQDDDQIAQ